MEGLTRCTECPYCKGSPCFGCCMQKILREMRDKKKEGSAMQAGADVPVCIPG